MPEPKEGQSLKDYLDECIPMLVDEGKSPRQAVAICHSMYSEKCQKSARTLTLGGVDQTHETSLSPGLFAVTSP